MLIAEHEGERIDATRANKSNAYCCPECKLRVILRRGLLVSAHFAHERKAECIWASGETKQHLDAKRLVYEEFINRGIEAQLEYTVDAMPGDRRADVMLWSPKGLPIAFELQHSNLGLDEILDRAKSYTRINMAQIWIPFVRTQVWEHAKQTGSSTWLWPRYPVRPFERWIHGFLKGKGMWMFDAATSKFWRARLGGHLLYKESSVWFSPGGEENFSPGAEYLSTRYMELTLNGPYELQDLRVHTRQVFARREKQYRWPSAVVAYFEPKPVDS